MDILQPPLKIVQYPHPSLRHKAVPLKAIDKKVQLVAGAMLELMYENHGLGLAAPQVGLPFQMFVVNYAGDPEKRDLEGIYINPVLRPAAAQNLLRISCTAAHTERQVERLVDTIERVAKRLEIEF